MMSDGYCDQFSERTDVVEKYNVTRIEELLKKISSEKNFDSSEEALKTELNNWKGSREQVDDVLVLGLRIN